MKRNANGNGSVRKISVARDGKTYTYWQARYSAGLIRYREAEAALHHRENAKRSAAKAESGNRGD